MIKKWFFPGFFFLLSCLIFAACAHDAFKTKLKGMTDTDLVNYYHGINDRIKDIGNKADMSERADYTRHDQEISQAPFLLGGEGGLDLLMKQKEIQKEINRRNLSVD
ncbi:MAG: hypothetical protein KKD44_04320 [Proteobacteria bacterium]|nr:hypothetical protein [Pseudomonadota bacterium]